MLVLEGRHLLIRHGPALHIDGALQQASLAQDFAHLGEVAPELHEDQRIRVFDTTQKRLARQRARQHAQHIIAPGHGRARRRPAAGHARNPRANGDGERLAQPHIQMHERAVK